MGKRMPRCLSLLFVVISATVVVATGSSVSCPDRKLRGYARLLQHEIAGPAGQASAVTDCLMEQALLRRQGDRQQEIPAEQFEALRGFCRNAALEDEQRALRDKDVASQGKARRTPTSDRVSAGRSQHP